MEGASAAGCVPASPASSVSNAVAKRTTSSLSDYGAGLILYPGRMAFLS